MIVTVEQSFDNLREHVHGNVSDDDANRGRKLSFNRTELQRFHCTTHGVVVPLVDRYDCPYCMPFDPTEDGWSYTVTVGSMVSLNAS